MAIEARSRRGNALYLVGNPDGALAEHRRVLAWSPDHPESLFFVGAILLEQSRGDKAKLEEGKKYWRRLLAVAPDSPRAPLVKDSLPRADEIFAPKAQAAAGGGAVAPPVQTSMVLSWSTATWCTSMSSSFKSSTYASSRSNWRFSARYETRPWRWSRAIAWFRSSSKVMVALPDGAMARG